MKEFFSNFLDTFKWNIPTDKFYVSDFIQIIIIFFILYYIIKNLKNTRGWVIVKGLLIIFIIYGFVYISSLTVIQYLMEKVLGFITIAIVIMFQPELRKIIENIGKRDIKTIFKKLKKEEQTGYFTKKTIDETVIACNEMAKAKTGALIVFEKDIPLVDYISSGIELNADITNQILINTFEKNTPLHDGAVIIQNNKIKAATCYLPLSESRNITKTLGTRHRAGIGITENTDAFVVIVSEETGHISWCEDGKIKHNVSINELTEKLQSISLEKNNEILTKKQQPKRFSTIIMQVLIAIASVFIWGMVLNANDQVITKRIEDIPVQIINEEALDAVGQTYEVKEGDTIDVSIKGKRSIIDNITSDDIEAIANFKKLSYVYSVPIELSLKNDTSNALIEIKPISNDTMVVELEEIVETSIPIEVETVGYTTRGYYVHIDSTTPEMLKISGSKSKINILDKAVVTVDISDKTTNFISAAKPVIYDKNGNVMQNDIFTLENETIKVNASVYETKEVPINVVLQNNNNNSNYFELVEYKSDSDMVLITAKESYLANIDKIDIPIELSDNSETNTSILINLKNYLPDYVYLANEQSEQIQLDLTLNKYTKMDFVLSPNDVKLSFTNRDNTKIYKVISSPITISAFVNEAIITQEEITPTVLNPSIKIDETEDGEYETELKLTNIDGILYTGNLSVLYSIEDIKK